MIYILKFIQFTQIDSIILFICAILYLSFSILLLYKVMQKTPTYIGIFAAEPKDAANKLKNYSKECL